MEDLQEDVESWLLLRIEDMKKEATKNGKRKIDSFRGEYQFLSNMFPTKIEFEGKIWNSSENIYQSFKTGYVLERAIFPTMTPSESKNYWKNSPTRTPQFFTSRVRYMERALRAKFSNPHLKSLLLATGDAELIEGNWWGDTFWGVFDKTGKGHNMLGKLLMKLREEYHGESEEKAN